MKEKDDDPSLILIERMVALLEVRYTQGKEPWKLLKLRETELEKMEKSAEQYLTEKAYNKAADVYLLLATLRPFYRYWRQLAEVFIAQEKFEKALDALGIASLIEGENSLPHLIAAECYLRQKKIKNAERSLKVAKFCGVPEELLGRYQTLKKTIQKIQQKLCGGAYG